MQSSSFYVYMTEYGGWRWRSEMAVFVEAVKSRREGEARKAISGAERGSPGRPVQAGIRGKRLIKKSLLHMLLILCNKMLLYNL